LERLNKEFVFNEYGRRFNTDQQTVISAIVGQENSHSEYSKIIREQRDYFQKVKMCRTFNFLNNSNDRAIFHSTRNQNDNYKYNNNPQLSNINDLTNTKNYIKTES